MHCVASAPSCPEIGVTLLWSEPRVNAGDVADICAATDGNCAAPPTATVAKCLARARERWKHKTTEFVDRL